MPLKWEWDGFAALDGTLHALTEFDATLLMERFEDIIVEGNRRGVLAGLDGNNRPMPDLKYRGGFGIKTRDRKSGDYGTPPGRDTPGAGAVAGPYAAGFDANLTSAQYRELDGPRLAPRRTASRVITRLETRIDYDPSTKTWEVIGAWADVVSKKGVKFLPYHFDGMGRNPVYDLRPVRPEDRQFALNALKAFMREQYLSRL